MERDMVSMGAFLVGLFAALILGHPRAWADIPTAHIEDHQEGCAVWMQLSYDYADGPFNNGCTFQLTQIDPETGQQIECGQRTAQEESTECECRIAPWAQNPQDRSLVGMPCGSLGGDCTPDPENQYWCYCTTTCTPIEYSPGAGTWQLQTTAYPVPDITPVTATTQTYEFDESCGHVPPSCTTHHDSEDDGGLSHDASAEPTPKEGCSQAGGLPRVSWLLVLGLFLLGASARALAHRG